MRSLLLLILPLCGFFPAQKSRSETGLQARLEGVRAAAGLPALGAALVDADGLQEIWVTGVRRAGSAEPVQADDLWHLGSCTKSMTATLIALLVARGDLAWDTPLLELLPALATDMDAAYRHLTLVELLCHRAGLPANPTDLLSLRFDKTSLLEQRARVTRSALVTPPSHAPRDEFLYSNTGFVIAGHIAEVATGETWEMLLSELLFEPLGMHNASFGAPGVASGADGVCDQPRGHTQQGRPIEPGPMADNPSALGPAGTVHASLADWAKYIQLHLAGARGDVMVGAITLTRETFELLHAPYPAPGGITGQGYGLGWVLETRPWAGDDGAALWHNGSNTLWYCVTWLGLGNGLAVLITTNQASALASSAADQAATLVIQEFQHRREQSKPRER